MSRYKINTLINEELDGPAVSALQRAIAKVKQRWLVNGWVIKNFLCQAPPCFEGTLSRWPRLNFQWIAPTNLHWACVVGYGPFSLCFIHKEGLCPSSGDINRLMMNKYTDQREQNAREHNNLI
jgi:hypothetical protein